jgi:hypothetical protein
MYSTMVNMPDLETSVDSIEDRHEINTFYIYNLYIQDVWYIPYQAEIYTCIKVHINRISKSILQRRNHSYLSKIRSVSHIFTLD